MYYIGLDLGQRRDHTAIAVVNKIEDHRPWGEVNFICIEACYAERVPLGTPYPAVVDRGRRLPASAAFLAGELTLESKPYMIGSRNSMSPRLLFLLFFSPALHAQLIAPVHSLDTPRGPVPYTIDGPFAVTEGDIILGPAQEVELYRLAQEKGEALLRPRSLTLAAATTGPQLWPNATIYYTIDADVPNQQSILDGIAHWNTRTPFKILPRSNEPNYVRFQHVNIDAACNSNIGMVGGAQTIGVTNNCPTGSVIHELGHAFGLWHEQQRNDRNAAMTVLYENIDKRYVFNYPVATNAIDTGYYDFDSIMHYGPAGFSRNYQDGLATVPLGIPIGQRVQLSPQDIEGASRLYKLTVASTTITTTPTGLPITVDGVASVSPQTFVWGGGTQHTISVNPSQGSEPHYQFIGWTDGGAVSHTITASPAERIFNATFVRQHVFAFGVSAGKGTVKASVASETLVNEGTQIALTAVPEPGYQFVRWVGSTSLNSIGRGTSANPAVVEVRNLVADYEAVFTTSPVSTIDSIPSGALLQVDGTAYLTPVSFTWTPGSSHVLGVSSPQLSGNNSTRHQFSNWDDGSTLQRTVQAGDVSKTYTATFIRQYLITTQVSGNGTVTISPPSPDGFYDAGANVQATAVPGNGQTFRYWLGDAAGGSTSVSITADEDKLVTAYFGAALPFRALNSASFLSTAIVGSSATTVAPGEIVAIFGTNLGPATGVFGGIGADGKLPFNLAGTTVTFDGIPAPLIYVSAGQINTVVPYGVAGKSTTLIRIVSTSTTASLTYSVAANSPALFTYGSGTGQLAALNENGSVNSPSNPAAPGSVVVLYGTGVGTFDKNFPDGQILATDLGRPTAPVWVRFGRLPGEVLYAGTAPYLLNGALQVNVRLPDGLNGGGSVPVQLLVGTVGSQPGVTISVAAKP